MKEIEHLLKRLHTAVVDGIRIVAVTDKNTFVSDALEIKLDQSKLCMRVYLSAEDGFTNGFIDEAKKKDVQQTAKENLTKLAISTENILHLLKMKHGVESHERH